LKSLRKTQLVSLMLLTLAIGLTPLMAQSQTANKIPAPTGTIAFVQDGKIHTVDVETGMTDQICDVPNGDGRLAWSADGEKIFFTRSGSVEVKSPTTGEGGFHRLYDLFFAEVDSAYTNNRLWWQRLTSTLGCRDPEVSEDGKTIVFLQDLNAKLADPVEPNYQVCTMPVEGGDITILRKDYANPAGEFLMKPTMNSKGQLAAVYFTATRQLGLVVLNADQYMTPMSTIKEMANANYQFVAPNWSHDGTKLAFVSSNADDGGLYLANADMSEPFKVFAPPAGIYVLPFAPSFSPDDNWLTFSTGDGSVWICDVTGNGARRLNGPGLNRAPAWSPVVK
jgi:Tol biopolymer transport system component